MKRLIAITFFLAALTLGAPGAFAQQGATTPEQNMCIIECATDEAQCREACEGDEGCKDLCSTDAQQCAAACVSE